MDLYRYSDPGQSQSSETLNELIENEKKRVKAAANTQNSNKSSSSASTQTASASFPPTTNSTPPYNLYGLAAKEDETQSCDDEEEKLEEEGSQKENIGAPRPKNDNGRINQALQNRLPRTPATPGPSSPMKSRKKDNGNELYLVSNQGSGKKTTMTPHKTIPSSRYKPRPRPRSASQDSFAQDPSEDHQRKLLLQPEHLPLPLDQLSKRPHIDTGNSTSGTPRAKIHFGRRIQQSPHMGKILVASTPSNSEASQDDIHIPDARQLSEQLEATQLVETQPADDPMNVDQEGYQSSEPSSSYGALLDGERELEPTQPTTEADLSGPLPTSFFPSLGLGTTASSVPRTSGPRSLLTTVRPENQWRYAYIQPAAPGIKSQPQQVQPAVPRANTSAETQPSNDEYLPRGPGPMANVRGLPSHPPMFQNLAPPQEPSRPAPPQRASSPPLDSMDIVPDSEPSRLNEPVKKSTPVVKKLATPKARSPVMRVDPEPVAPWGPEKEESKAEESDEDDTPLATKRRAPPAKGAKSAATKSKGKDKMKDVTQADPTPRSTRAARSKTQPARNKSSYEYAVIPSSMPEQDFSNKPRTRKAPSAKTTPMPESRSVASHDESDDDDDDGSEQEETDVDEDVVDEPGPSKKRKRAATKRAPSSKPKRQKKASKPTPAPTRVSRRTAYLSQQSGHTPTRVFAMAKHRGYYEIATVYSHARSGINFADTYMVRFAKGDEAEVSAHNMRQAIVRKGDEVIPPGHKRSFRVAEDMPETADSVDVDMNGERQSFKLSDLRLACASIRRRWDDRQINEIELVFMAGPGKSKFSATPTPNRSQSTTGSNKWPLHKTALMVTLNSNDADYYAKQKSEILEKVAHGGGQVIEDFTTVLQMEGKLTNGGQRWIIKKDDVKWIGDGIDRLFLVADECNHKPKFLLALALGIPCLSLSWLRDIVENEQTEWAPYLLPQGFSAHLGCRASQRVDLEWGTTIQHTQDIMNNSVAPKVFENLKILCVGGDVVPKKVQDTGNALPRIMLAMGAEEVEAVASTQYASRPLSEYNYIVTHKPKDRTPDMPEEKTFEWTWVKDCLMASRLISLDRQIKKKNV